MSTSRFHKSKQRRAERAHVAADNLNLVPLVDILTSVVFFSLLTYTGAAMAALTAFDLALPPVMVTAQQASASAPERTLNLLLAVRIQNGQLLVEHSGEGGFRRAIAGTDTASLDQLEGLMREIRQRYPQNSDVLVVPDDATSYDDVVRVLERLRLAQYSGISLGSRARATQVATATGGR